MGKSLDFVKERITSGFCNGMENNTYKFMIEQNTLDIFKKFEFFEDSETSRTFKVGLKNSKSLFTVIIKYDPNADFEYFTMQRCICDGTFVFFQGLMAECLNKMIHLKTCNVNKTIPKDLSAYSIIYTVGDYVLAEEFGKEFSTEDKPWMRCRFTAMLPIKFDVMKDV